MLLHAPHTASLELVPTVASCLFRVPSQSVCAVHVCTFYMPSLLLSTPKAVTLTFTVTVTVAVTVPLTAPVAANARARTGGADDASRTPLEEVAYLRSRKEGLVFVESSGVSDEEGAMRWVEGVVGEGHPPTRPYSISATQLSRAL